MSKYKRLIFVCLDNVCRSPMAAAVMKQINRVKDLSIESRGIIVLFPEPYNPKARSILLSNDIILENGSSTQIENDDFSEETLVLTMDRSEKNKLLEEYDKAQNVYTIMEFANDSGDILDPYGGDMDMYALFFESINTWVTKVENILFNMENDNNTDTDKGELR